MTGYLSINREGNGVVGATGHLCHSLAQQVGGNQGRVQAVVGGAVAQLAVAVMAPSKHLSVCGAAGTLSFMSSQWFMFCHSIRSSGEGYSGYTLTNTSW